MSTLQLTTTYPHKRAFITGAGSGLGRELALRLATDGWYIGIADISLVSLTESKGLIEKNGGKVYDYVFDVSDRVAYQKDFEQYIKQVGGIDLLINNAGVGDGGLVEEYGLDNWEWIVGINQMGVLYGCHFAIPIMKKQGFGHIINIASAAGFATMPNMSMYNVTKAAVIALSETLYAELMPFGVYVSVVMPTFFKTNVMQHGRGETQALKIGTAIVQRAKILPQRVAKKILHTAGKKKFHIFYPFQARLVWVIKRLLPFGFLWTKMTLFKRKEWLSKKILDSRATY